MKLVNHNGVEMTISPFDELVIVATPEHDEVDTNVFWDVCVERVTQPCYDRECITLVRCLTLDEATIVLKELKEKVEVEV